MGIQRLLRKRGGLDRRASPRVDCRLQCSLKRGRRWLAARVLDVSDGGLCVLSPIELRPKQPVVVRIDVPRKGPVAVEAVAWHVRRVKSGRVHRKAWSIGMIIRKADVGFEALLPNGESLNALEADEYVASTLAALPPEVAPPDDALEEDALSAADLDELDLDLLSPEELALPGPEPAREDQTLHMFRVRVKSQSGPRTRALTFGAVSAEEAESLARAELGAAWQVLEVSPA